MVKKEKIKSFYDIELEAQVKEQKKQLKDNLKYTIWDKIADNIWLIGFIILCIALILELIFRFYNIVVIGFLPLIAIDKHFIPWDVLWNNWMYWSSMIYWLSWILIIIYLLKQKFTKENNSKSNKWYYKKVLFTLLWVYLLFYITNPWYTLQTHPRLFLYQNWKNITNKEIYFFLTEKYWFKADLYKPFKTLDDSIEGLEFAKKINSKWLYSWIFYDLERFWYDNVFKKYNDLTFQAYFIKKIVEDPFVNDKPLYDSNINIIWNYKKHVSNEHIIEAINYIEMKRNEYEFKNKNIEFYWELYDNVLLILKKLYWKWINNDILPL